MQSQQAHFLDTQFKPYVFENSNILLALLFLRQEK